MLTKKKQNAWGLITVAKVWHCKYRKYTQISGASKIWERSNYLDDITHEANVSIRHGERTRMIKELKSK